MRATFTILCTFCAAYLVAAFALVAQAQDVSVKGNLFLVSMDSQENEIFTEPENQEVSPGDLLEYRFVYHNGTAKPLSGMVLTGPIPELTFYIGNSAWSNVEAIFEVQLLAEEDWDAPPIVRRRKLEDDWKEVVVPPSEYGALRWTMQESLPVDAEAEIRYRVRVRTR